MSITVSKKSAPRVAIENPATAKVVISKRTSSGLIVDQNTTETSAEVIVRRGVGSIRKVQDIENVNSNDLQDGYALLYDTTTEKWIASPNAPDNVDGGYY